MLCKSLLSFDQGHLKSIVDIPLKSLFKEGKVLINFPFKTVPPLMN